MRKSVTIAAVGDILMWKSQIDAARQNGSDVYSFAGVFAPVASILQSADFTIGNLETTFSGSAQPFQIGSARTGFPRFNCPDQLALDLRDAGFDLLTTANNHCLDGGWTGLCRTLDVLDRSQLAHTGTYRTREESLQPFITEKNGIRIGVLAYTYGTNKQRIPLAKPWMVNLLQPDRITAEIASLRPQVDFLIVCLHFGVEFRYRPTLNQRRLVQSLLEAGSDVILGAHPHVLQPIVTPRIPTGGGSYRQTVAAYSLGNFTSARMLGIRQSQCGTILLITAEKDESQQAVVIPAISAVPTYCQRIAGKGQSRFRVMPLRGYLRNPDRHLPLPLRRKLQQSWNRVVGILGRRYVQGVK